MSSLHMKCASRKKWLICNLWMQVMILWIATFWFVGSWIVPFLAHSAGFSRETLTYRGQALYSLLTDITEGLAGIAILHQCLGRFRPLPPGWFEFNLKGRWILDVVLGCSLFPLVNLLSHINISLVPMSPGPVVGVSSVEQSIVARDPVAMALYAVVVTVCAPIWEEILFRGFLLPSLTRYMPLPWSILTSAAAFALAHFNAQRVMPLIFLGLVMGGVFARSRNLLASMVLHSLWNVFVFLDLMKWAMRVLLFQFRLLTSPVESRLIWLCFLYLVEKIGHILFMMKSSNVMQCIGRRNHVGWREDETVVHLPQESRQQSKGFFFNIFFM
jgi:membrane protease YdiL (CAAX protease family)